MRDPLVSVITTVYNNDKFIEESLRSIFDQSFKDFEFIVFNDCSKDNTWEIIEKTFCDYDGDYTIINSNKDANIGCAKGRTVAIDKARGKYLAVHDGDDVSYKNRLEKEVGYIESHPDLFCVGAWADEVHADGSFRRLLDFPKVDHNDFVRDLYKGDNTLIDPTSLFKKEVFDKLGGYDFEWKYIPDLNLWARAMIEGYYFSNIQESLIDHRKHGESIMCNYSRHTIFQHKLMDKTILYKHKKEVFFRR